MTEWKKPLNGNGNGKEKGNESTCINDEEEEVDDDAPKKKWERVGVPVGKRRMGDDVKWKW